MPVSTVIPRELLRSTPRSVTLSRDGAVVSVLAFILVLGGLVGAAFLYVQAERDTDKAKFRTAHAATTTGQIVSVQPYKREKRRWIVNYAFTAEDGLRREGKLTSRDRMEAGSLVAIAYVASDPADNWLAGHRPRGVPYFLAPLPGLGLLGAAALIFWQVQRQKALLRNGRPAIATASAIREIRSQHGRSYRVAFDFSPLSGATRHAKIHVRRPVGPVGTEFVILYDPDQLTRVARYPMSFVKIL